MTAIESNKLIAEFMGWDFKEFKGTLYITSLEGNVYTDLDDLNYNSSYDWIMPVVEKIEMMNIGGRNPEFFIMYDSRPEFKGWYWNIEVPKQFKKDCLEREESKIQVVYQAVVEFILWYNENHTK